MDAWSCCTKLEKLCLKWNYFSKNVNPAFGNLRKDNELANVTFACEDINIFQNVDIDINIVKYFFLIFLSI